MISRRPLPHLPASHGRQAVRAASVGLLAVMTLAGALFFAAPAGAAETLVVPGDTDVQAWFWSSNQDVRQCSPILPPPAPPDSYCQTSDLSGTPANPISPGHFPVALKDGSSDMRSYFGFSVNAIPAGSTVSSATMELTVARASGTPQHATEHGEPSAKAPATTNESAARIKACLVTGVWDRAEGAPPSAMDSHDPSKTTPTEPVLVNGVDCGTSTLGVQGNTWKFDMKPFVLKWLGGVRNRGVVLMPVEAGGPLDSWTVEFHGARYAKRVDDPTTPGATREATYVGESEQSKLSVTYVAPPTEPEPTFDAPPPTDGGGVLPPPVETFEPVPSVAPSPTGSPQPTLPVARSEPRTPWYAWLLFPLGMLGIVVVSRSLGREAAMSGGNRVATLLRTKKTLPGE